MSLHRFASLVEATLRKPSASKRRKADRNRYLLEALEPIRFADQGLLAYFFLDTDLTALAYFEPETTFTDFNFDWPNGASDVGVTTADGGFSARWTGTFSVGTAGTYGFEAKYSDGVRLIIDGQTVIDHWTSMSGDVNGDGIVNQLDLNVVNGHWQQTGVGSAGGDINGDGIVNQIDLNSVLGQWQDAWGTPHDDYGEINLDPSVPHTFELDYFNHDGPGFLNLSLYAPQQAGGTAGDYSSPIPASSFTLPAPVVAGMPATVTGTEGSPVTVQATFGDPKGSGLSASVDWGDGSAPDPNVSLTHTMSFTGTLSASHAFASGTGVYSGTLTLSGPTGSQAAPFVVAVTPAAPTNVTALATPDGQVAISWQDNSSIETGYNVYLSADGGATYNGYDSVPSDITSYHLADLAPLASYSFKIEAFNDAGASLSAYSAAVTTIDSEANAIGPGPSNPTTSLDASNNDQLTISWSGVLSATSYELQWSSNNGATFQPMTSVTGGVTSYEADGLAPGTNYEFRVRGWTDSGATEWSATNVQLTMPRTPTGLSATPTSPGVQLSWNAVAGADNYVVQRSEDGTSGWTDVATTSGTSTTDSPPNPQGVYYYQITSQNGAGASDPSPATKVPLVPAVPFAPVVTPYAAIGADFEWLDKSANQNGYEIQYSTDGMHFQTLANFPPSATTVNQGLRNYHSTVPLQPNVQYDYRIAAYNDAGYSGWTLCLTGVTVDTINGQQTTLPIRNIVYGYSWDATSVIVGVPNGASAITVAPNYDMYGNPVGMSWFGPSPSSTTFQDVLTTSPLNAGGIDNYGAGSIFEFTNGPEGFFNGPGPDLYIPEDYHMRIASSYDGFTKNGYMMDNANPFYLPAQPVYWTTPYGSSQGSVVASGGVTFDLSSIGVPLGQSVQAIRIDLGWDFPAGSTGGGEFFGVGMLYGGPNLTAYRTGGKFGEVVDSNVRRSEDPSKYLILTNNNNDEHPDDPTKLDYDDDTALIPSNDGSTGDKDLARITISQVPSYVTTGSIQLSPSNAANARFFASDGTELSGSDLTLDLSAPSGYLAGLASHDVDVYVEGLKADPDLVVSAAYIDGSGVERRWDTVHMTVADFNFLDSDGNVVAPQFNADAPSNMADMVAGEPGATVTPESKFNLHIDGLKANGQITLTARTLSDQSNTLVIPTTPFQGGVEIADSTVIYASTDNGDPFDSSDKATVVASTGLEPLFAGVANGSSIGAMFQLATGTDDQSRTVSAVPPPVQATNETATANSSASVTLAWDGGLFAKSFQIQQLGEDGLTWTTIATQSADAATTYQVAGLTGGPGHVYSWRVIAVNKAGTVIGDPVRTITTYPVGDADKSARETALWALVAEESRHKGNIYYEPAGVRKLFDQLSSVINWISSATIDNTLPPASLAQYRKLTNSLTFRSNVTSITMTHELVHALDDRNSWHFPLPDAEILAYSVERMLSAANSGGIDLTKMQAATTNNLARANGIWNSAWSNMESIIGTPAVWFVGAGKVAIQLSQALTSDDIFTAENETGLFFHESSLHFDYADMLIDRGVAGAAQLRLTTTVLSPCFK